ncbi:hypothetical protein [Phenylobacterium aquaticum]|uniref:hypothetical protein n=1 Tax=Phenylobacterium aquaticum TaxID=1763816 RepID=UPI0026ED7A97|nr:hypothetical protein [Phenylobacterium aquaticum]
MKFLLPIAASTLALTAGACAAPTNIAVATGRLDCPMNAGELTRISAATDGKTCLYHEADGAEVTLKLVPVTGGVDATLTAIEDQLKSEAGAPAEAAEAPEPPVPPATPGTPVEAKAQANAAQSAAEAAKVSADAAQDAAIDAKVEAKGAEIKAKLDAHGVRISDDNETTHVNLPGIHISADGDKADVRVGPIHVNANGETAIIKMTKDVRMRGEALSMQKRGLRATFIYAGDALTGGYKFVGYEASGPKTGPLAVAIVKAKANAAKDHSDIYDDVKKLVRRNGGA